MYIFFASFSLGLVRCGISTLTEKNKTRSKDGEAWRFSPSRLLYFLENEKGLGFKKNACTMKQIHEAEKNLSKPNPTYFIFKKQVFLFSLRNIAHVRIYSIRYVHRLFQFAP